MAGTVYALGSILVDLTVDVPALPARGGDVLASATRTVAGGGINLASAVARQGISCVYGGPHGTGPYGDVVRAALKVEGIATVLAARTDGDTGFCVTLVEPDGERTFVTMPGVEAELRPGDLSALRPERDDVISLSGYDLAYPVSGPVLVDWLSTASTDGARTALDPGPLVAEIPPELLAAALPRLRLLTLNQREARLFCGADEASGAELVDAVRRVPGLAFEALVVVREGGKGCLAAGGPLGDEVLAVPAPSVEVVDTTGAGDTHTGVLLAALAAGNDVPSALTRANRAAAISVTRRGPATAPTAIELDTWPI